MTVRTIGAAYRDHEKIDLFDRDASKEARSRARQRERETDAELGIVDVGLTVDNARTVEELRKAKEHAQVIEGRGRVSEEKERAKKEKLEQREKR